MVSRCCGDTFEEVENIEDWNETHICSDCGNYCDTITDYDYRELAYRCRKTRVSLFHISIIFS